jgi:maltodextrin utilization protein YvdJ
MHGIKPCCNVKELMSLKIKSVNLPQLVAVMAAFICQDLYQVAAFNQGCLIAGSDGRC